MMRSEWPAFQLDCTELQWHEIFMIEGEEEEEEEDFKQLRTSLSVHLEETSRFVSLVPYSQFVLHLCSPVSPHLGPVPDSNISFSVLQAFKIKAWEDDESTSGTPSSLIGSKTLYSFNHHCISMGLVEGAEAGWWTTPGQVCAFVSVSGQTLMRVIHWNICCCFYFTRKSGWKRQFCIYLSLWFSTQLNWCVQIFSLVVGAGSQHLDFSGILQDMWKPADCETHCQCNSESSCLLMVNVHLHVEQFKDDDLIPLQRRAFFCRHKAVTHSQDVRELMWEHLRFLILREDFRLVIHRHCFTTIQASVRLQRHEGHTPLVGRRVGERFIARSLWLASSRFWKAAFESHRVWICAQRNIVWMTLAGREERAVLYKL